MDIFGISLMNSWHFTLIIITFTLRTTKVAGNLLQVRVFCLLCFAFLFIYVGAWRRRFNYLCMPTKVTKIAGKTKPKESDCVSSLYSPVLVAAWPAPFAGAVSQSEMQPVSSVRHVPPITALADWSAD